MKMNEIEKNFRNRQKRGREIEEEIEEDQEKEKVIGNYKVISGCLLAFIHVFINKIDGLN
jgi:hypothetical protein